MSAQYKIWRQRGERGLDRLICRYLITDGNGFPIWYTATRRGARRFIRNDVRRDWRRRRPDTANTLVDVVQPDDASRS